MVTSGADSKFRKEGDEMKSGLELAARADESELRSSLEAASELAEHTDPPNQDELDAEEYWREEARCKAVRNNRNSQLFSTRTLLKREWEPQSFLIGPRLLPKSGRMLI